MTKYLRKICKSRIVLWMALSLVWLTSCEDNSLYEKQEPEWLGGSLYDYLESSGKYSNYLQLVQSASQGGTDYAEILRKTGNKTLFVADDEAFEQFYANNEYGIRSMNDMSESLKRMILFSGMLDDTYLLEMLSSTSGLPPARGQAMRHLASLGVLDSLPYEKGSALPANSYWERFQEKSIYVLKDDSRWTMVHFLPDFLVEKRITNEDLSYITNTTYQTGDSYIFGVKVKERDVTCKNGYIHVLEKVLVPPGNMAEYIRKNTETSNFSRFLERYCAPYYSSEMSRSYVMLHPEFRDSIFVKRFFTPSNPSDPEGYPKEGLLKFDPGWNAYQGGGTMQADMASMFVPSNAALERYFNGPEGSFLKDRYHTWDNVPDAVLKELINNHMWISFVETVPSRFSKIEDKMGTLIGIQPEDISYASVCNNGVVYVTDKVYPPTEYIAVTAPVLVSENTRVINWAVSALEFNLYLLSMVSKFTFLVPTDEALANYLNPVSMGKPYKERWSFRYDPQAVTVLATVFDYDTGDSLRQASQDEIKNALNDIINNHIIIGELQPGRTHYMTKGYATLKINASSSEHLSGVGGGNVEQSTVSQSTTFYHMANGNTYFMDHVLESPVRSVYNAMRSEPRFNRFFELCVDAAPFSVTVGTATTTYGGTIFQSDRSFAGVDLNVGFFNTFHYTVYIPTNEAVDNALAAGIIKDWETIRSIEDLDERGRETQKLYNFLRYHFQDNSVYISGETVDRSFDSATLNPVTEKFYRIQVDCDGNNMQLTTASGGRAQVLKGDGLYNIMVRDYKFNSPNASSASQIATSSFAVIHQVDAILNYQ